MGHFQLRADGTLAQVRLGAVVHDRGRVLLHRPAEDGGPWAVPGGRLEVGEQAAAGLAREFREELDVDVEVGPLLCIVENFFEHWPLDGPPPQPGAPRPAPVLHHELGLYFAVTVPSSLGDRDVVTGREAAGTPEEHELEFAWVPVEQLAQRDVRPVELVPHLAGTAAPGVTLLTAVP